MRATPYHDRWSIPENVFVLSEDQQRMIEDATQLASGHGYDLRVVDLTKESFLKVEVGALQGNQDSSSVGDRFRRNQGRLYDERGDGSLPENRANKSAT